MARSPAWSDPLYATSLANGLKVLEAFGSGQAALTNKALAGATGLSPATITRLTCTLATLGLLRFDPMAGCHRLSGGALTLANPLMVSLGVRRLARLSMKQLSDQLGGTVSLGMRDRADMVYVETSRGQDLVAFRPDVGARLPLLQSAIGRAWLAGACEPQRLEALEAIRLACPGCPGCPARHREAEAVAAQAALELSCRGYCVSRGDFRPDVHAAAVPLDIVLDGERLVLNCGVPTHRLAAGDLDRVVGPSLVRLARRIGAEWHAEGQEAASAFSPAVAAWGRDDHDDREFARTLARGIRLLQAFRPGGGALGNGELSERLGLAGPTVARLTHTLTLHGYLRRDTSSGRYTRYRLGAATIAVAYPLLSSLKLREQARPAMLALAKEIDGAVSLGMRHQDGMVYVETAWRTDARLVPPDTGTLMPMLASAMGRAWLSSASPAERETLLNQVRVRDRATWAAHAGAVRQSIEDFPRLRYCWSRAVRQDIEAFAVPLAHPVDGVRYVMNCGVFAASPLHEDKARAIGLALAETVAGIDRLF